ncbi:hypothetical protein GGF31_002665 [Allomyces arbusculus]|nr:hypothetical protein GGF31_002665 [Allomyces arbusculus]
MKFGHQIETEMSALPPDYRPLVLSYKTLKKQLKGIVRELEARGVTPELLEALQRAVNPQAASAPGAPAPCLYSPEDLLAASEPRGPVSDDKPENSVASASTATPVATETESTATTTTAPAPADTDSLRARSPSPVSSRTSSPGSTPGVEELDGPPLGCTAPSHERTAPVSLLSASLAAAQLANAEAAPSNGAGAAGLDRRVSVQTTATMATTTTSTSATSRTSSTMSSGPKISYVLEHPPIEEEVEEEEVVGEDTTITTPGVAAATASTASRSPPGTSFLSTSPDSIASSPLSSTTHPGRRRSSAATQFDSYLVIQMDEETRQSCEPILQGTACEVTEDGALKVRLASDAQFFAYLSSALHRVGDFQRDHVAKSLHTQLTNLVREMSELTRVECPDHATWRGIIRAYLESDMFLTMSYKPKSPQDAADTLFKFESTVARALAHPGFDFNVLSIQPGDEPENPCAEEARKDGRKHSKRVWTSVRSMLPRLLFRPPVSGFRDKRSWAVYSHFLQLNHELLALQRFVELNSTAVRKILKKHDKKTRLPSQMLWHALDAAEHADPLHAAIARTDDLARIRRMVAASSDAGHEFTRALVTAVNQTLEGVTPQLATYTCPICADILYPPVRLPGCGHLLCYPCADRLVLDASVPKPADLPPGIPPTALALPPHVLTFRYPQLPAVSMKCPMCRHDTKITRLTMARELVGAEDAALSRMLRRYFPDEVKAKRKQWSDQCTNSEAELMALMMMPGLR